MPTWTQSNFNGGEWSPLMYGRFTLDKYKTSVAQMLGFVPQIQGGITRRPGTRFVSEVLDSANPVRLVRFEFNVTQAYVLEFGPYYIRFYANDGQVDVASSSSPAPAPSPSPSPTPSPSPAPTPSPSPAPTPSPNPPGPAPVQNSIISSSAAPSDTTAAYQIGTAYAAADLFRLSFVQSADVVYITHQNYPTAKLERHAATDWTLTPIAFQDGPYLPLNITPTTLTISAYTGSAVAITASSPVGINNDTGFQQGDVGRVLRVKNAGAWGWGTIVSVADTTHITVNVGSAFGGTLAQAGSATLNNTSVSTIPVVSGGSGYAVAPSVVVGTPSGVGNPQAQAQTIVDKGVVTAILVTYPGVGYTAPPGVYIAGPPSELAPFATTNWRLGVWSQTTGFPAVATFHEDRLFLGGCTQYPQRLDGSNTSDYENMAPTEVDASVLASNAVGFSLNARDVNSIYWMLSDEKGLQVGGAGAEWLVRADNTGAALSPTNIQAKPSTFYGSAPIEPVKPGSRAIFMQRGGRKVREATFTIQQDGFSATDISLVSEHLTRTGIAQLAVQRIPQQIVWMARNDGLLVGMTYEYEQDVVGFHEHRIGGGGIVESVCCIPNQDGTRDELWLLVRRTINGVQRRYVEVMTKFWESGDSVAETAYLDSSAEYSGAPATHITGLGYLEGQTVSVLADGATHPDCVVSGGAITLNRAASVVQVGLGYTSTLMTHRMEVQTTSGVGQLKYGRITEAAIRVTDTLGGQIGVMDANRVQADSVLYTILDRTSADMMGSAPALRQGDIVQLRVEGSYESYNQLIVQQTQPLPFNLQMLTAECQKAAD